MGSCLNGPRSARRAQRELQRASETDPTERDFVHACFSPNLGLLHHYKLKVGAAGGEGRVSFSTASPREGEGSPIVRRLLGLLLLLLLNDFLLRSVVHCLLYRLFWDRFGCRSLLLLSAFVGLVGRRRRTSVRIQRPSPRRPRRSGGGVARCA